MFSFDSKISFLFLSHTSHTRLSVSVFCCNLESWLVSNLALRQTRTLCACQHREQVTSGYRPKFSYDFGKLLIIRWELDDLRTKEWVQYYIGFLSVSKVKNTLRSCSPSQNSIKSVSWSIALAKIDSQITRTEFSARVLPIKLQLVPFSLSPFISKDDSFPVLFQTFFFAS